MKQARFHPFCIFVFTLSCLLCVAKVYCQASLPLHFEALTINDGLSQGFVSCITQDKKGFMWFATSDGLNKYDGYAFTVYHHNPLDTASIADDEIAYVYEDAQERLWICTRKGGLDLFDRERGRFYHIKQSPAQTFLSNASYNIKQDRQGALWIRMPEGIYRLQVNEKGLTDQRQTFSNPHAIRLTPIQLDEGISPSETKFNPPKIFIDSRGAVFATTTAAIYQLYFNGYKQKLSLLKRFQFHLPNMHETADLTEDTVDHLLLLHTDEGLYTFSNNEFVAPRLLYKSAQHDVLTQLDKRGWLWLNENAGLTRLRPASGTVERTMADNVKQAAFIKSIFCFYTDRTGVLWMGTSGYGVLKYDPARERFHTLLTGEPVYRIYETVEGKIVVKDVYQYAIGKEGAGAPEQITEKKLALPNSMYAPLGFSCQDNKSDFWFCQRKDLVRYNVATKKATSFMGTVENTSPACPFADSRNAVWISSAQQLMQFNPSTQAWRSFQYPVNTNGVSDFLQVAKEDSSGVFWLGTKRGLFRFDSHTESWTWWPHNDSDATTLSNNFIISLCADPVAPKRYLWIGTKGGGLNRLDKQTGRFAVFTTDDGLPNNVIYGIVADQHNQLWLSTNKGLSRFDPATKQVDNFDASDGLQGTEFNRYAYCKTRDNWLVFGGLNGINYFNADDIQPLHPPGVVLTDFKLFNKSVDFKTPQAPLQKSISFTGEIILAYKQNMFTLQFAAMDYRKAGSVRYRYRMKGFDNDWIYSGTAREATYTNLDPGTYYFTVEGSNTNSVWGAAQTSLTIRIIPPWWRTWWFYALATLCIGAIVYAVYRYRVNQLLKLERVRNRIARDLHDEIGSSLSTISIYSKVVQAQLNDTAGTAQPLLKKISDNANEMQDAMGDIVWSINTKNDSFENLTSRMQEHAVQLLEAKQYALHFNFDEGLLHARLDIERRKDFYLIYKEALNNIAKYAEGKNVWISLISEGHSMVLAIKDDGVGFLASKNAGTGNGLHNMQIRAAALRGAIEIDSEKGSGTTVQLRIPK